MFGSRLKVINVRNYFIRSNSARVLHPKSSRIEYSTKSFDNISKMQTQQHDKARDILNKISSLREQNEALLKAVYEHQAQTQVLIDALILELPDPEMIGSS